MNVVAAFDFDGTLTTRDCVVPFLEALAGRSRLVFGIVGRPVASMSALVRRDRDRLKAIAVHAAYAGRDVESVTRLGITFAEMIHARWLRTDTPRRLEWHRQQGHRVVLVSASMGTYLHPLGTMLGVDDVLCTEVLVGADQRFSGEIDGTNCRGPEKVRRLSAWLASMNLDDAEVWAYGDSVGDHDMLASSSRPLLVKGVVVPEIPEVSR